MKNLGYYNGTYGRIEDIYVPLSDRACLFGDGVYDATYAHNHIPFALEKHIDRFFVSAKLVDINIPYTKQELEKIIRTMIKKVDSGDTFVYFQASRATQIRDHIYEKDTKANIWLIIKPAFIKDLDKKICAITLEDKRFLYCNIKTINLLPSVLYANIANDNNCYEAILHRNGIVTECAHSNVGIIKDNVFVTPPLDCRILAGVARANIIEMCQKMGIKVEERTLLLEELFSADEVIICSAGSLCLSVEKIDNLPVGGRAETLLKSLQSNLLEEFWEATKEPLQ